MRRYNSSKIGHRYSRWALLPLAFLLFGCDAESPTTPTPTPIPPVTNNPPASSTWNITVTADPDEINIEEETSLVSNITVVARRFDNGQPVPNGTTALLTTSLGTLTTSTGSGQSVALVFDNTGTARAVLNATSTVPTTVVVRAQIEQSFGSANISFLSLEPDPFQIRSISPISGPPSGGTLLTLTGSGFEAPVRVSFGVQGQTLLLTDVRVESSTRITARTPAIDLPSGQNALASLTLENGFDSTGQPSGTDVISSAFTYTRNGGGGGNPTTLKIFSLSPTSGPNEGGTRVTILGEGFGQQVQVYFTNGPLIEAQIVSVTSTRLEVLTPSATGPNASNANSRVNLRLVDSQTGGSATLTGAFQYGAEPSGLFVSSISPNQDEYLGGRLVTLFGQGFEEPVAVTLGGFAQQVISVTGTEIVVRSARVNLSCASVSQPASVTNIETNERITNGPNFTYLPILPAVVGVFPDRGDEDGLQNITITGASRSLGRGFQQPLRVLINGVLATVIPGQTTETVIAAVTPPFTGTFATAPCTIDATTTGTINVPFAASVQVINLDTGCEDTLTGAYTYIPDDLTCHPPDAEP